MQHVLYKHSSQGPLQQYESSQHHHQLFQLKKKIIPEGINYCMQQEQRGKITQRPST